MSKELSNEEIIKISHDWDYAYSEYQVENFVVNTGVVDYRKAKQCLIEIEQRQQAYEDVEFGQRKSAAEIEILKESLSQETSPAKKSLIEIEIEEKQNHLVRGERRLKGIRTEQLRYIEQFKKFAKTDDEVKQLKESSVEEERKYWIARMGKQAAMEMLSYGKIGTGNMESIMQMPKEDQMQVISGALEYTKKMETGIIAIEQDIEKTLIDLLKNQKDVELIPTLANSVAKNAKLLGTSKS